MRKLGLLLCLTGALAMAGAARANDENGDGGCAQVHAIGVGQDYGAFTTATITHGGALNGTTRGVFSITGGAPPVFTIAGAVVFTTKHGTLTVQLQGTFNVATGEFRASGPITAGTGQLAGSTGTLTFAGVENLATGAFTETITGTLCRAEDGADE